MTKGAHDGTMTQCVQFSLTGLAATETLARRLALMLKPGDIVALRGDLGTGKTALSRATIQTLGGGTLEVPSPTFTLVQLYELPNFDLWHFDFYRLEAPQDALELNIEDAFATGASLIEWPEQLGPYLPRNRLDIHLSFAGNATTRHVNLVGGGHWVTRMDELRDG